MAYINYDPTADRDTHETLTVDTEAHHGVTDLVDLVDRMIAFNGGRCSAPVEGAKDAIEDGSIWADLCAKYGDDAVQGALEELHELI